MKEVAVATVVTARRELKRDERFSRCSKGTPCRENLRSASGMKQAPDGWTGRMPAKTVRNRGRRE